MSRGWRDHRPESPILTGYLPPYDPVTDPRGRVHAVYGISVAERLQGLRFALPGEHVPDLARLGSPLPGEPVPDPHHLAAPLPAHFTSLHLLFTAASFNEVIPFDPEIY